MPAANLFVMLLFLSPFQAIGAIKPIRAIESNTFGAISPIRATRVSLLARLGLSGQKSSKRRVVQEPKKFLTRTHRDYILSLCVLFQLQEPSTGFWTHLVAIGDLVLDRRRLDAKEL